jgi:hypothetical protein
MARLLVLMAKFPVKNVMFSFSGPDSGADGKNSILSE